MKNKFISEQATFIVDKYLVDNQFQSTRYCFRNEASFLFAHSPIHEAPKNLMTLNEMLEDYISLKEQKETMDKEKANLEHAKNQILMLIQIVRNNAMNMYNVSGHIPPPAAKSTFTDVPQPAIVSNKSHPGISTSGLNKLNTQLRPPSSISNISGRKRKDISDMDAPSAPKQHHTLSGGRLPIQGPGLWQQFGYSYDNQMTVQCSSENCMTTELNHVQESDFSKFMNAVPCNSPVPKTSLRSMSSQSDTNISSMETSSFAPCDPEAVSTSYNAISCKRVMASPSKQMASKETSHCISPVMTNSEKPSKSDHEESMLGFDSADVPESLKNLLFNEISTPASEDQFDNSTFDLSNLDDVDIIQLIDFSC